MPTSALNKIEEMAFFWIEVAVTIYIYIFEKDRINPMVYKYKI